MKAGEMVLKGTVIKKLFAAKSKSEHEAVCLDTGDEVYKLKMPGGNPFYDPALEKWVGKNVVVTGKPDGFLLVVVEIEALQDAD